MNQQNGDGKPTGGDITGTSNFLAWLDQLTQTAGDLSDAHGFGRDILPREDVRKLVLAFAEARTIKAPDVPVSLEECKTLVQWGVNAILSAALVQTVLEGDILLDVQDGQVFACPKSD